MSGVTGKLSAVRRLLFATLFLFIVVGCSQEAEELDSDIEQMTTIIESEASSNEEVKEQDELEVKAEKLEADIEDEITVIEIPRKTIYIDDVYDEGQYDFNVSIELSKGLPIVFGSGDIPIESHDSYPYRLVYGSFSEDFLLVYNEDDKSVHDVWPNHEGREADEIAITMANDGFAILKPKLHQKNANVYFFGDRFIYDLDDSWSENEKKWGNISYVYPNKFNSELVNTRTVLKGNVPDDYTIVGLDNEKVYFTKSKDTKELEYAKIPYGPLYSYDFEHIETQARTLIGFGDENEEINDGYNYQVENGVVYYQDIETNEFYSGANKLNIVNGSTPVVTSENIVVSLDGTTYVYSLNGDYLGGFSYNGIAIDYIVIKEVGYIEMYIDKDISEFISLEEITSSTMDLAVDEFGLKSELESSSDTTEIMEETIDEIDNEFVEPNRIIMFVDKEFEAAVRDYYGIKNDEIYWKDIGYQKVLETDGVSTETLEDLKWFVSLKKLELRGEGVNGDLSSISSISSLSDLEYIFLWNTGVTGNLSSLSNLSHLEDISLGATVIAGNLSSLSGLGELKNISLGGSDVVGDLISLSNLRNLELIDLGGRRNNR